ncbi:DUF397 domain-containing protein [Streptomyces adustus]
MQPGQVRAAHGADSGSEGDSCVEVAITEQAVHVRDSKDMNRPAFAVGREEWVPFVRFVSES